MSNLEFFTIPWTGNNNFDVEEISFSPIVANQLIKIESEGTYRSNNGAPTITIDLRVDGTWITIYDDRIFSIDPPQRLDAIPLPITFNEGIITELRLATDLPLGTDNYAFQGLQTGTETLFEFARVSEFEPQPVNEPQSFLGGLILIVLMIRILFQPKKTA